MTQKRNYDRMYMSGTVIILIDPETRQTARASLEELSSRGLSVISPVAFEVGSIVLFELSFDFMDLRFSCKGAVRHITPVKKPQGASYRIGLELSEFNKEMFTIIMTGFTAYKRRLPPAAPAGPDTLY